MIASLILQPPMVTLNMIYRLPVLLATSVRVPQMVVRLAGRVPAQRSFVGTLDVSVYILGAKVLMDPIFNATPHWENAGDKIMGKRRRPPRRDRVIASDISF